MNNFPMQTTKISPIIFSNSPGMRRNESFRLTDKWEDNYGSGGDRHNIEYWQARRAFLNSYHFTEEDGFKDKLKSSVKQFNEVATHTMVDFRRELSKRRFKDKLQRSFKEVNEVVMNVAVDFRRELSRRRLTTKAFKFKLKLSSLVFATFGCFTPWLKTKEFIEP
ncbi:hypothetical protein SLA2020_090960 [Shorea laevis]